MKKSDVKIVSRIQRVESTQWMIAALFAPKGWKRRTCIGAAVLATASNYLEIYAAAKKADVSIIEYLKDF